MLKSDCSPSSQSALRDRYRYLPKDFIETAEGLIFAVVAPGLEEERVLAFLRYQRRSQGLQKLSTEIANQQLSARQPGWIFHSPRLDARLHGVPRAAICRHYLPSSAWSSATGRSAGLDNLRTLVETQPTLASQLGLTGSYLLAAEQATSDIDVVAYGIPHFQQLQNLLAAAVADGRLQTLSDAQWQETYQRRGCELSFEEYVWHEQRKLNKFYSLGTRVDVSCVTAPHPAAELAARKLGRETIVARVIDDRFAFASPAVYAVEHPRISHVLAFTPTYAGQVREGETLQACGWLEQDELGGLRLVVGSSREAPGEFIRLPRPPIR